MLNFIEIAASLLVVLGISGCGLAFFGTMAWNELSDFRHSRHA